MPYAVRCVQSIDTFDKNKPEEEEKRRVFLSFLYAVHSFPLHRTTPQKHFFFIRTTCTILYLLGFRVSCDFKGMRAQTFRLEPLVISLCNLFPVPGFLGFHLDSIADYIRDLHMYEFWSFTLYAVQCTMCSLHVASFNSIENKKVRC